MLIFHAVFVLLFVSFVSFVPKLTVTSTNKSLPDESELALNLFSSICNSQPRCLNKNLPLNNLKKIDGRRRME